MKRYILTIYLVLFSLLTFAQSSVTITGTVTDAVSKKPLESVSVRSAKTNKSLGVTQANGTYSITTTSDDILSFTYAGYEKSTVNLAGRTNRTVNVSLKEANNFIEDIVVQGFTKRSRKTLTGSSINISGKDLQENPVPNLNELLQGKVAGLNIQMNNGTPGVRGSVFMRGLSNLSIQGTGVDSYLTPTSPLYIVDGVRVDDNTNFEYGFASAGTGISPLSLIPPEDVESVDILKDAASTALYGSRGAYGVIIITTKRGKSQVPVIQYTTNQFLSVPPQLRDVLGGRQERLLRMNQVLNYSDSYWKGRDDLNQQQILTDSLNPYFNNSTNWQAVFMKPTYNQSHNVSASGGDTRFNYKINGNYYKEKGIIQNTGFNRYTMDMNSQFQPNDRFRMFASMSGKFGEQQTGSGTSVTQGGVASASSASSLLPSPEQGFVTGDLVSALDGRNDNRSTNLVGMLELEFEILKDFRFKNTFSYNYSTDRTDSYTPAIANNNTSKFYNFDGQRNTLNNMSFLSYFKQVNKHNFSSYLFNELDMKNYLAKAYLKTGFPNDQLEGPFGYASSKGGAISLEDYRSAGFGATFAYNYDLKYVLDLSYRIDKTSTIGPEQPWVKNPAVSVRWNMENEPFLENVDWIGNLALRGSWGKNIVPTGTVFDAYGKYIYTGYFNNQPTIGFNWGQMPNQALKPSTTTSFSAAVEGDFFGGKFNTIQEVYYKQVDNELFKMALADHNGFGELNSNDLAHVTYGYEFTFSFRPLPATSDWSWRFEVNGALNRDVLTLLPAQNRRVLIYDAVNNYHTLYILGRNALSHVLYDYRGVYSTDADVPVNHVTGERLKMINGNNVHYFEGGDPIWTDINGDYIIDDQDLVAKGNAQPRITGGFSSFLTYKNWSLNLMFSYVKGRDIINAALANQLNSYFDPLMTSDQGIGGKKNSALLPLDKFNFWTKEGDVADYPNPYSYLRQQGMTPFRPNQTLFMEDGSYLKFNSATVRYSIPRDWTKRYHISAMSIYATANNIYTFSTYSGLNPEGVTDMGFDRTDGYPNRRSYSLGLNIQF